VNVVKKATGAYSAWIAMIYNPPMKNVPVLVPNGAGNNNFGSRLWGEIAGKGESLLTKPGFPRMTEN
jgi:hypothetical protein